MKVEITPTITIAIPFFNREEYLSYAIRSVINQSYSNWELLLIDDGSTDTSVEIAERYAKQDSRIRVIVDGQNKGLPTRLNETVNLARGKYYARMDDDDIMECHRIEKQFNYLVSHPNVDVIGSSAMIIDDKNKIVKSWSMEGVSDRFIHPSIMGKLSWFKHNSYDSNLKRSQDKELWLRTARCSSFYNMPEPLLFYREFGVQSLKRNLASHKAVRDIAKGYKKYGKNLFWCVKMYAYTYIQDATYIIYDAFGKLDVLTNRRRMMPIHREIQLTEDNLNESIKE